MALLDWVACIAPGAVAAILVITSSIIHRSQRYATLYKTLNLTHLCVTVLFALTTLGVVMTDDVLYSARNWRLLFFVSAPFIVYATIFDLKTALRPTLRTLYFTIGISLTMAALQFAYLPLPAAEIVGALGILIFVWVWDVTQFVALVGLCMCGLLIWLKLAMCNHALFYPPYIIYLLSLGALSRVNQVTVLRP